MGIVIREISPPIKLSGLSSLTIQFNYNEAIINTLKGIGGCIYHKKLQLWEAPISSLAQICDNLTFLDDLTLTLLNTLPSSLNAPEALQNAPQRELTATELEQFRFTPFKHQIEAINFGLTRQNKMLLLDAPGVGKTIEIIGLAETLKRRGIIDHCLIVCCVNSIKLNWERELNKFSTETCRIVGKKTTKNGTIRYTSVKERAAELAGPIEEFFVITNIETLRDDRVIEAISKSVNKFGMIAVDEVHRGLSNSRSEQGQNLLKLAADYKVAATGTLITNNALSAFGPLKFIEKDHATLTSYKSQYCIVGGFHDSAIIGYKNLEVLREEIDDCSIRRTLDQVRDDIPKLQIEFEAVEMDEANSKFYEAIKAGVKEEADKIELSAGNLLALTTRLRQATACPSILTSQHIDSSKLIRCKELVEEIVSQGEKVVVFSTFKPPIYELAEMLKEYNPTVNTGDIKDDLIAKNVAEFQDNPASKVFLATGAKMGTGHTLNASMYLIFLDLPWTWSEFDQQYSRVYRVNNTRPAIIKVLGCANTIDERVWEIINAKKDTADYLVDGKPSESMAKDMRSIIFDL